jgi:hypothetical protein
MFSAPGLFLFEHFLPWIQQIMLAYQEQKEEENDIFIPASTKYSKAYYTKKIN